MSERDSNWYRLDNAAKVYPAVSNAIRTNVFRISVELKHPVKIAILQKALDQVLEQYPYFKSQLKNGFFWHWLEPSQSSPLIQADTYPPCRKFHTARKDNLLMRMLAKDRKISIEFMHTLTDGSGALTFLQAIICRYVAMDLNKTPCQFPEHHEKQFEDAYQKHFNRKLPRQPRLSKAYHLPFEVQKPPVFNTMPIEMDALALHKKAREQRVSITEYLLALYLLTLQTTWLADKRNKKKSPFIRVQSPVNLRKIFPSPTLRNFSLFVVIELDQRLGAYTFKDILRIVHHYMNLETDKKQLQRILTRNVGSEKKHAY